MSEQKKKPYELIPGDIYILPQVGTKDAENVRVDRVIIDDTAIVTVVFNGGRVAMHGRDQDLKLV